MDMAPDYRAQQKLLKWLSSCERQGRDIPSSLQCQWLGISRLNTSSIPAFRDPAKILKTHDIMQRCQREFAQTPPSTSGSSEQRLHILDACVSATQTKMSETHNIGRRCRCKSAKLREQQRLDGLRNLKSCLGTLVTD